MSKHTPEPWKINTEALEHRAHLLKAHDDVVTDLTRQRDELLALARAVVCHSTIKDVMGVKCAAFPWTEYEILENKVKEIADES